MEFLKEFLDEGRARVKSNVFASVVFAFVAVNWKVLHFLVFADVRAVTKYSYFDVNTDWKTLYVFPVAIGLILALTLPYINYGALRVISWAVKKAKLHQDEISHDRLTKKINFEIERSELRNKLKEQRVVEGEIEDRASKIEDDDVRKAALADLDRIEAKIEQPESNKSNQSEENQLEQLAKNLSFLEKKAMIYFSNGRDVSGTSERNYFSWLSEGAQNELVATTGQGENSTRAKVEFGDAVATMIRKKYLLGHSAYVAGNARKYWLEPTVTGYKLLDAIQSQDDLVD